jgi:hypothetical protein
MNSHLDHSRCRSAERKRQTAQHHVVKQRYGHCQPTCLAQQVAVTTHATERQVPK